MDYVPEWMKKNIDKEKFFKDLLTKIEFCIYKLKYEDKKLNHSFSSYV